MPTRTFYGEIPKFIVDSSIVIDVARYSSAFSRHSAKGEKAVVAPLVIKPLTPAGWLILTLRQQEVLCEIVAHGTVAYMNASPTTRSVLKALEDFLLIETDEVWKRRPVGVKTKPAVEAKPTARGLELAAEAQRYCGVGNIHQLELIVKEEIQLKRSFADSKKSRK